VANLIARAQGFTRSGPKADEVTRLGSESVHASVATWELEASVEMLKSGQGSIVLRRLGTREVIYQYAWTEKGEAR
jgi:hypothetical protein